MRTSTNPIGNTQTRFNRAVSYVRTPAHEAVRGIRTFYVPSESISDDAPEYTVKHSWVKGGHTSKWVCSCPDWLHRKGPVGLKCKHIRQVADAVARLGGFRQVGQGKRY